MTQDSRAADATRAAVDACRRDLPSPIRPPEAVLGFDGFVDTVRRVVDERHDPESFEPMTELGAFGERIAASADEESSITVEWTRDGTRTGGHTCHVARALIGFGASPTMIGAYGDPERDVFADEFGDARRYSFGEPNYTEAVEFDDGKLLVTETGATRTLDWETLVDAVGIETLATHLDGADLFGVGYWVVVPDLPSVLTGLREQVWPTLDDPPETVLVDPGDVRQLADEVLDAGIEPLRRFAAVAPVTLSANRAEMTHLADTLGATPDSLTAAATTVKDGLDLRRAVAHAADRRRVRRRRPRGHGVGDRPTGRGSGHDDQRWRPLQRGSGARTLGRALGPRGRLSGQRRRRRLRQDRRAADRNGAPRVPRRLHRRRRRVIL